MAPKTINGWPVLSSTSSLLHTFRIPGSKRDIRLRKDVGPYLVAFLAEYDRDVMPLDVGTLDDWGWAPLRDGRASSDPSNHCSGTAADANATKEGVQGRALTWWIAHPVKYRRLRALLKKYRLLRWGGDWKTFRDPMHFELAPGTTVAAVQAEMKKLGIKAVPAPKPKAKPVAKKPVKKAAATTKVAPKKKVAVAKKK